MTADPKPAGSGRQGGEEAHHVPAAIWLAVALMVVGLIVLGFALVFKSVPTGIVGFVVALAGAILAKTKKIMSYTE
ncbi:MAG: DUF3040 domain-containing protein [Actinomycetota bacterium]|nr:DUF3040 domain-containing protein [Actinomycetota bacterium]